MAMNVERMILLNFHCVPTTVVDKDCELDACYHKPTTHGPPNI